MFTLSVLAREYRRRTKDMATSQDVNMFLPASLGGLGFRRLSDIIQERKRAIVDRLHESPMALRVVVTAMIDRARRHIQLGSPGKHVDLRMGIKPPRVCLPRGSQPVPTCLAEAAVKLHPGQ